MPIHTGEDILLFEQSIMLTNNMCVERFFFYLFMLQTVWGLVCGISFYFNTYEIIQLQSFKILIYTYNIN